MNTAPDATGTRPRAAVTIAWASITRHAVGHSHATAYSARPVTTDPVIASTKAAGAMSSPPNPLSRSSSGGTSRRRTIRLASTTVQTISNPESARCAAAAMAPADTRSIIRGYAPPARWRAARAAG